MPLPATFLSILEFFGHAVGLGDLSAALQADLESAQAFIPLDITTLRIISSNEIHNLANHGGLLASDSNPALERIDGAAGEDCLRVTWDAEDDEIEVQHRPIPWPPDLDPASNVVVHLMLAREASEDHCQVDVLAYENGVGAYAADVEMGGKTTALTTTNVEEKVVTLAAANIAGPPGVLNLAFLPDAHGTDDLYLYAGWIEYRRKLRTS